MDPRKIAIVITSLAALGIGAWLSYRLATTPQEPGTATVLPAPPALADFALLDHDGNPFVRDDFAGHWNLLFFGFTHCPDICPLTLQVLASAREQLAAGGQSPLPRIVFVSVDPERDTPELIGEYVGYFDTTAIGVTGSMDELRKLTDSLGIFFEKAAAGGEDYSVNHSAVVIVVDPQGRFRAVFAAPHEIENFVADLPIIMAAS